MNSINYDDHWRSPTEIYGHLTCSDEFGVSKKFSWSFGVVKTPWTSRMVERSKNRGCPSSEVRECEGKN